MVTRRLSTSSAPQRSRLNFAERWYHFATWAMLVTLVCLGLWMGHWRWGAFLDNVSLDALFAMRGARPVAQVAQDLPQSKDIVIVALSHETPRSVLAKLLDKMHGARAIGLDFMFSDRESELIEDEKPFYRSEIVRWRQEDRLLAQSIARADNVVLGAWPLRVSSQAPLLVQSPPSAESPGLPEKTSSRQEWSLPASLLARQARDQAHLSVIPDVQDGLIRRVRLYETIGGQQRPCLALALATLGQGAKPAVFDFARTRSGILEADGSFLIDYLGPRAVFDSDLNRMTFAFALQMAEPEDFKDKIVLVGQTDERSKDIFPTPWGDMPGLMIHANIVATLLSLDGPPRTLAPVAVFAISLLLCLALVATLTRFSVWLCAPFALIGMGAAVLLMGVLFIRFHTILPLSVPVWSLLGTYNGIAIYEYLRARGTLGRVVGKGTAAVLLDQLQPLELGGEVTDATAFFCDLRGYTTLSQQVPPHQLIDLLNRYTAALVREVRRFEGRPIDYFGDGVFVLFEGPDHARRGVRAAIAVQRTLDELIETLKQESRSGVTSKEVPLFDPPLSNPHWLDPIQAGIALHTGPMVIGLVGAEEHFKPGAVGDTVNVASRLQGLAPLCGYSILLSRATLEACGEIVYATSCGAHQLRGREGSLEVFGAGKILTKP